MQITPKVDLPGATSARSTTYATSLMAKGYVIPDDVLNELSKDHALSRFSPSEDPKAIKSAAVRDKKTGTIYPGASHQGAMRKSPKAGEDLEDGYVTNEGKFLNRDAAYAQAVASKQYKPTDEDYNVNKILYGLTSERFNKQNPGAAVAGNYAKPIEGKKGRYSPSAKEAEQKATALPEDLTKEALNPVPQSFSPAQTKSPEFKEWFGDWEDPKAFSSKRDPSKPPVSVVVKGRKPLVVYHGTTGDFSTFDPSKKGVTNFGWLGQFETQRSGFFATPNPDFANEIIEGKEDKGKNVMPLYMNIKSPADLTKGTADIADELQPLGVNPRWVRNVRDTWELFDGRDGKIFTDALKKAGYDGAILNESDKHGEPQTSYVAFDPEQIKSASGNTGKFDPKNPNITFSPSAEDKDKSSEPIHYPMEMAPGKMSGKLPGLQAAPYGTKLLYQRQMLKAMKPLFDEFQVKPGTTTKGSYKNSAGETEHNPVTSVDVPAAQAKLFALMHGYFANQEAVAGGHAETSPGNWEPVSPHSFYETPDYAAKLNAIPAGKELLAKLEPEIGPAVAAVNEKWEKKLPATSNQSLESFSPSADPRAVKMAAIRDEDNGKIYTGATHFDAMEEFSKTLTPEKREEEVANAAMEGTPENFSEGFVTNNGEFLDREEAFERAQELNQYKPVKGDIGELESARFNRQQVKPAALRKNSENPALAQSALETAQPGQPVAMGTFSPPEMSDKTWNSLRGKKMLFVIGDQSNAGPQYITEGGKPAVRMRGGPGYPNMPETQGKAGWAFASKELATRLAKAFKNVDYMAVIVGSPNMIAGAPSFSKAYLAEIHEALASGQLKQGSLNRLAREAGRYAKHRASGGASIPTIHNFSELERLVSTPSNQWAADPKDRGLSFEARAILMQKLGSVGNSKKFGTPSYLMARDKYNDTGAFEQGQVAQIIQLHNDKPIGTAEEHGVVHYPDYPFVIPGTGLGQPPVKVMMADALKPWSETAPIAAQGGNLDYKVRMNIPQTEINPASFKK